MLAVVVDDILVAYGKQFEREYQAFYAAFRAFTEVSEKDPSAYIGFEIKRDRIRRTLTMSQGHKIKELLKEHRFDDAHPEELPAPKVFVLRSSTARPTAPTNRKR